MFSNLAMPAHGSPIQEKRRLRRSRLLGKDVSPELLIENVDLPCNHSKTASGEQRPKLKVTGIRQVDLIVQPDAPRFEGLGIPAFSYSVEFEPSIVEFDEDDFVIHT